MSSYCAVTLLLYLIIGINVNIAQDWSKDFESKIVSDQQKFKLVRLCADLLSDGELKISQFDEYLRDHSFYASFEIGMVLGRIREKYKLMMEQFKETKNMYLGKVNHKGPYYLQHWNVIRPVHYIIKLELIHGLENEIEMYVEILEEAVKKERELEEIQLLKKRLSTENRTEKAEPARKSAKETSDFEKELELKRRYRQEYLNRKLGRSANVSTTKKRFIGKWPVEDTWQFLNYN